MPGCLMAMARLNRPSVFVYGGTILPGNYRGKDVDIVSVFEAVGAHSNKDITDSELKEIESCAIPGAGSCGGDVHREHHGFGNRGPRDESSEQLCPDSRFKRQG